MGTPPTAISNIDVRNIQAGTGVYISCLANTGTNLAGTVDYGATDQLGSTTTEVLNGNYLRFGFYISWPSGGTLWYKINLYENDTHTGVSTSPASTNVVSWSPTSGSRTPDSNDSISNTQKVTIATPSIPNNFIPKIPTFISHEGQSDDNIHTINVRPILIFSTNDVNANDKHHFIVELSCASPSTTITANSLTSTLGFSYSTDNGENWSSLTSNGAPQGSYIKYEPQEDLEPGTWTWKVKATDNESDSMSDYYSGWEPEYLERTFTVQSSSWETNRITLSNIVPESTWEPSTTSRTPSSQSSTYTTNVVSTSSIVTSGLAMHLDAGTLTSLPLQSPTWYDLSGNNKNGTLTNGPKYSSTNGGLLTFDGSNDYVQQTATVAKGIASGSVELWFNATVWSPSSNGTYMWTAGTSTGGDWMNLGTHPSFGSTLMFGKYTTAWLWAISNVTVSAGTWYHAVGIWGSSGIKLYINGSLNGTNANTSAPSTSINSERIGCGHNASEYFNGKIPQFRIYNRVLSLSEIQQNFNATKARYGL